MSWYLVLENNSEDMIKILEDIKKKENLSYSVKGKEIWIEVNNKDEGHKKGSWYHHKTKLKPFYKIVWK